MTAEISADMINSVLNELIEKKSKRDGIKFTSSQLASALDLPRSSISRLIHPDREKRLTNPTIGTLIKIVDFFKTDGINVSIDDFVGIKKNVVNVQEQEIELLVCSKSIPIYNWSGEPDNEKSTIKLDVGSNELKENLIALLADKDIKPIFKKGSIFIINKNSKPKDGNIIGIKINENGLILIRKYHKKDHIQAISEFEQKHTKIDLESLESHDIIGVVIRIIAKT